MLCVFRAVLTHALVSADPRPATSLLSPLLVLHLWGAFDIQTISLLRMADLEVRFRLEK